MEDLRLRLARASAGYILQGGLAIASRLFGRVAGPPIPVCTVPRDLHGLRLFRSRAGWSEKRSSAGLSRGDSLRQVRYIVEVLVRIVFFVPRGSKLFCPLQNVLRPLRVTPHLGNRKRKGNGCPIGGFAVSLTSGWPKLFWTLSIGIGKILL